MGSSSSTTTAPEPDEAKPAADTEPSTAATPAEPAASEEIAKPPENIATEADTRTRDLTVSAAEPATVAQTCEAAASEPAAAAEDSQAEPAEAWAAVDKVDDDDGEGAAERAADALATDDPLADEPAGEEGRSGKARSLEQLMSLKPGDDERTEMSKKLSWILRHGAKKVNVDIDEEGWISLSSLCCHDILNNIEEERLLAVIDDSNQQKMRYELKEVEGGRRLIRAVSKSRRREQKEKEAQERRRRREEEEAEYREAQRNQELDDRPREPIMPDLASIPPDPRLLEGGGGRVASDRAIMEPPPKPPRGKGGKPAWWDDRPKPWARNEDDGYTYEEQENLGFVPVYLGEKIIAMCKDGETVRPGRREHEVSLDAQRDLSDFGASYTPDRDRGLKGSEFKGRGRGYDVDEMGYDSGGFKGRDRGSSKDGKRGKKGNSKKGFLDAEEELGFGEGYSSQSQRLIRGYWRVAPNCDAAIMRACDNVESEQVCVLRSGMLVSQLGEDKTVANGIVRMHVEAVEGECAGLRGWVTRTAEAAGGPKFFLPDRPGVVSTAPLGRERAGSRKGDAGDRKASKPGKGRKPSYEGEGKG